MNTAITATAMSLAVVLLVVLESALLLGRWCSTQTTGAAIALVLVALLGLLVRKGGRRRAAALR